MCALLTAAKNELPDETARQWDKETRRQWIQCSRSSSCDDPTTSGPDGIISNGVANFSVQPDETEHELGSLSRCYYGPIEEAVVPTRTKCCMHKLKLKFAHKIPKCQWAATVARGYQGI